MAWLRSSVIKLTHQMGLSPLMRRARQIAHSRAERLSFRYDKVVWEAPNRPDILLPANKPYYLWTLVSSDVNPLEKIVGDHLTSKQTIDLRKPAIYRTFSGLEIWSPEMLEDADACSGYFQNGAPKPGEIAVDVGAFCGEITVEMALRVGPNGHVYALEPDPQSRVLIHKNLELHGLNNVTVLPHGLWSESTTVAFAAMGDCGSSFECVRDNKDTNRSTMKIMTLSPSDLLARIGQIPHFIKMDIEGAEVEVVRTLAPLLAQAAMPTKLAIASYHLLDGHPTHETITPMLLSAGFSTETGYPSHTTTWAQLR